MEKRKRKKRTSGNLATALARADQFAYNYQSPPGLDTQLVDEISGAKNEPPWMRQLRQKALKIFQKQKMPPWAPSLQDLNFQNLRYYLRPLPQASLSWDEVPPALKRTFEKIGLPRAEQEILAGVKAQFDSEVIYGSLRQELAQQGVIFLSMEEGLQQYPELVQQYFARLVPPADNKMAALNTAVWSGGSFIYVPPGVKVKRPLQVYFRINSESAGQFERTLIIVDREAELHYIEGCSAPLFSRASLHAAVVEIFVHKGAKMQYTTIQNWYKNVFNLVTKRARVEEGAVMRWLDGNLGSRLTMKYPCCLLAGAGARGETLSLSWAGEGQHQDLGAKMIHLAPQTRSRIISKSVSKEGGRCSYRGLIQINPGAHQARAKVVCDALLLDSFSRSDTYPVNRINESDSIFEHEATVSQVGAEQIHYLQSRGLTAEEAESLLVSGFLEPIIKEIPLEYAVELNRLIELEMEGSVG